MKEEIEENNIYAIDCLQGLRKMKDESVQCCITSPPYWKLRNYGVMGQFGLEHTPEAYVEILVELFDEVRRVLKPDGTLWLNLGDMYWGSGKVGSNPAYLQKHKEFNKSSVHPERFGKPSTGKHKEIKNKDLIGFPWMVAFALRKQGWYLRQDIIWHKPNPMPESITDRCTKSHEYIFLLSKNRKYYFDHRAIQTDAKGLTIRDRTSRPARKAKDEPLVNCFKKERSPDLKANRRSVWSINNKPFREAHFATFPTEIPELCMLAGSKERDVILDPFMGAGTTALVATKLNRKFIGFELNPEYVDIAVKRLLATGVSIEKLSREN